MNKAFFFDSYAIVEILNGNDKYAPYADAIAICTKLNMFEVYHYLLKEAKQAEADTFLKKNYIFCIDYDLGVISAAVKLKMLNRKLSMADCIGYIVARKRGILFLTGDKEFISMHGVELVR